MNGDGSAGTALLGLPGFRLLAVSEQAGELEQAVETIAGQDWCSACGVAAVAHGRRLVQVRDLPSAGRPVTLLWVKRLWAVPRAGVFAADVDRAQPARAAAGVAD